MSSLHAQSWNITGNKGLTTSNFLGSTDNHNVIFKANNAEFGRIATTGFWRFGGAVNFAKIDTSGKLTFGGNGAYQVAGNKYVFQYSGNLHQGLFFDAVNVLYEFMNGSAVPVFTVNANTGNSAINGTLKIGAYTLPSTDGTSGQALTTNGKGTVSWSNVSGSSGANTSLSNLAATTAINAGLLPKTNNSVSLGSSGNGWTNIYIDSALYIYGIKFLAGNTSTGNTGIGLFALSANTTGFENVATGTSALNYNTVGNYNTANGNAALYSNTSGSWNTANGYGALYYNTTGSYNTANGAYALKSNTTGNDNAANGLEALYFNTTGSYNTANGMIALYYNTTGGDNTANGYGALNLNSTGSWNTANGDSALYYNTTGNYNTATGANALDSNTTGAYNTATGFQSLHDNTTGNYNTANGLQALYSNTTGYENTANGLQALYSNTRGYANTANGVLALYYDTTGDANTANGFDALYSNTTGSENTANGVQALYSNTTGNDNTANGDNALYSNTTGLYNTANGYDALYSNTTGNENTALGEDADVSFQSVVNATVIGYHALVDASNKVRIGNTGVSSIGGQVGWTTFSDGRYKKNIKQDVQGLKFINLLKPITYTVDINGLNAHYDNLRKHDSAYDKAKAEMQPSADAASKIIYNGFIAQDIEKAAQSINYNFSGVDKPQNKDGLYGLRYSDFVVPLVKAVQELSSQNDSLKSTNSILQSQLQRQQSEIDDLKALVLSVQQQQQSCACSASVNSGAVQQHNVALSNAASLEQNVPNPFTNTTTIGYSLSNQFSSARIIITDKNGRQLKQININGASKGTITVDASTLSSGAYQYSLIVDGRLIDTKQMVLAR
jgi:hypothetical protein